MAPNGYKLYCKKQMEKSRYKAFLFQKNVHFQRCFICRPSDSRRIEMITKKTKEKGVKKNRNEGERKEKRSKEDGNKIHDIKNI